PGRSEDRALRGTRRDGPRQAADVVAQAVVEATVGAAYVPGLLALREGPVLAAAVAALPGVAVTRHPARFEPPDGGCVPPAPDVLLVDASGADHPRRAGLAVHLGWALDLPTVGITRRPLRAATGPPAGPVGAGHGAAGRVGAADDRGGPVRGWWAPLFLDGDVVAALVGTRT